MLSNFKKLFLFLLLFILFYACLHLFILIYTFKKYFKGWGDIGYNFVIGGDGRVYEGAGWSREGVHTYAWNKKSYGISFVGNYMSLKPKEYMLHAARKLIVCGIKMVSTDLTYWCLIFRYGNCQVCSGNV